MCSCSGSIAACFARAMISGSAAPARRHAGEGRHPSSLRAPYLSGRRWIPAYRRNDAVIVMPILPQFIML
jgi:hypothetical protein